MKPEIQLALNSVYGVKKVSLAAEKLLAQEPGVNSLAQLIEELERETVPSILDAHPRLSPLTLAPVRA